MCVREDQFSLVFCILFFFFGKTMRLWRVFARKGKPCFSPNNPFVSLSSPPRPMNNIISSPYSKVLMIFHCKLTSHFLLFTLCSFLTVESKDIKVNKTENESNKLSCSSCVVALSLFLYAWVCLWSVMWTSEACPVKSQGTGLLHPLLDPGGLCRGWRVTGDGWRVKSPIWFHDNEIKWL